MPQVQKMVRIEFSSNFADIDYETHRAEMWFVTPELAQHWLDTKNNWESVGSKNRRIQQSVVDKYASVMVVPDSWMENNQGIGFAHTGMMTDGQHRLKAIIKAGVGIWLLVVFGLDPDSRKTVDTGKVRTIAQILRMYDYPDASRKAATARVLTELQYGKAAKCRMTADDAIDMIEHNKDAIEVVGNYLPAKTKFYKTAVFWGPCAFAYGAAKGVTVDFLRQLSGNKSMLVGATAGTYMRMIPDFKSRNDDDRQEVTHCTLNALMLLAKKVNKARKIKYSDEGLAYFREIRTKRGL